MSAMVHAKGYQSMPLRTGYEQVIGARTADEFAYTAKMDGVIEKITDEYVYIKNKDGSTSGVKIGTNHGIQGGLTIPQEIITDFKVGDKVKEGDIVAWNKDYFERDWLNPKTVTFKVGAIANVAFMEGNGTLEDSSLISAALAEKLGSAYTKRKVIVVDEDDHVLNMVKIGDETDLDSPLCIIQDGSVSLDSIDEQALAALSKFSNHAPKAKIVGKVSDIQVLYRSKKENMSESVKKIVEAGDRRRAQHVKATSSGMATSGYVDKNVYVSGNKVEPGQVAIEIFIDQDLGVGIGDKGVLASQLKTVFGGILTGTNETLEGDSIDMIFGWRSVMDRIVLSAEIMGIVNAVLMEISRQASEKYFKE